MNSLEQAEDLKAFERRLTEYIACLQPATGRWRMILIVVSVCTATGAWNWLIDPETQKVSFFTSLWNHPFFTISCITLIGLFFAGIHKRVVAPSIIAARCRTVLAEYNMSCDDLSSSGRCFWNWLRGLPRDWLCWRGLVLMFKTSATVLRIAFVKLRVYICTVHQPLSSCSPVAH
ncbi:nuclear envelope phosphatase-regulatory subunit 1 isoform X1 [Gallus gallus]|uniref:Nuclear envelope phosphatase-regulatory subunit 1 n=1 Tax=Gallus gallus TaxID=9031 RepID=A0A8V0ZVU7_CHICK|nr:nuclear envelope phosphatase-regulatory subunit 1 isoform X1 [Gallus gallus]XP_046781437.1 nuclear envelope phosphatase-regulatory subunit 1 isoform X1 [Gallus gallus]